MGRTNQRRDATGETTAIRGGTSRAIIFSALRRLSCPSHPSIVRTVCGPRPTFHRSAERRNALWSCRCFAPGSHRTHPDPCIHSSLCSRGFLPSRRPLVRHTHFSLPCLFPCKYSSHGRYAVRPKASPDRRSARTSIHFPLVPKRTSPPFQPPIRRRPPRSVCENLAA